MHDGSQMPRHGDALVARPSSVEGVVDDVAVLDVVEVDDDEATGESAGSPDLRDTVSAGHG
jgi:hypothetical protein